MGTSILCLEAPVPPLGGPDPWPPDPEQALQVGDLLRQAWLSAGGLPLEGDLAEARWVRWSVYLERDLRKVLPSISTGAYRLGCRLREELAPEPGEPRAAAWLLASRIGGGIDITREDGLRMPWLFGTSPRAWGAIPAEPPDPQEGARSVAWVCGAALVDGFRRFGVVPGPTHVDPGVNTAALFLVLPISTALAWQVARGYLGEPRQTLDCQRLALRVLDWAWAGQRAERYRRGEPIGPELPPETLQEEAGSPDEG